MPEKQPSLRKPPIHNAWIICLTGMAVLFSCLELGKFRAIQSPASGHNNQTSQSCRTMIHPGCIYAFFGAGQTAGSAPAGMIAETTGSFSPVFFLCGVLTAAAAVLTVFLNHQDPLQTETSKKRKFDHDSLI